MLLRKACSGEPPAERSSSCSTQTTTVSARSTGVGTNPEILITRTEREAGGTSHRRYW